MFCTAFLSRKSDLLNFSIKIGPQPTFYHGLIRALLSLALIFLLLENSCTFLLAKKTPAFSTLTVNRTEIQIMPFKTTLNQLFNDTCYLVIGSFDRKIGIFQQAVVRGLLYP